MFFKNFISFIFRLKIMFSRFSVILLGLKNISDKKSKQIYLLNDKFKIFKKVLKGKNILFNFFLVFGKSGPRDLYQVSEQLVQFVLAQFHTGLYIQCLPMNMVDK